MTEQERQLTDNEEGAMYQLVRYAFHKPDTPARAVTFEQLYAHSQRWGVGSPVTSGFLGTKFTVDLAGVTYPMSGIGYVASYPEHSGGGSISRLMSRAFTDMREAGITLSYLAPFANAFYRRFGYDAVFNQTVYTMQAADLPKFTVAHPEATKVVRVPFTEAIDTMLAIYNRNAQTTAGAVRRERWWLENMATHYPNREVAIAELGGHPAGYVMYERDGMTFTVHESFSDDWDVTTAILAFVRAHQSAFHVFKWVTPTTQPLFDLIPNAELATAETKSYMMARIVNLEDFMQRYPYQVTELAPITMQVQDDAVPANAGVWTLAIDDGQVRFEKTDDATPMMTLDQRQLVKAALGARSLVQLHRMHLVDGEPYAVTALSDALTNRPGALYDYF